MYITVLKLEKEHLISIATLSNQQCVLSTVLDDLQADWDVLDKPYIPNLNKTDLLSLIEENYRISLVTSIWFRYITVEMDIPLDDAYEIYLNYQNHYYNKTFTREEHERLKSLNNITNWVDRYKQHTLSDKEKRLWTSQSFKEAKEKLIKEKRLSDHHLIYSRLPRIAKY